MLFIYIHINGCEFRYETTKVGRYSNSYSGLLGKWLLYFFHFSKRGFNVKSYGSGTHVKLPGVSADKPNIYPFNTPYDLMYRELYKKDPHLYLFHSW